MTYRPPSARTLVATALVALIAAALLALARPVEMVVDGERVETDVPPVTARTVFVPVRPLGRALGARTELDAKSGRVLVTRGNQSLRLRLGDAHGTLNGMPVTLKQAPFRVRGRVMVPLKLVADAFGVRATYNPRAARIDVTTPLGTTFGPAGLR